jgi:hypothetical protein
VLFHRDHGARATDLVLDLLLAGVDSMLLLRDGYRKSVCEVLDKIEPLLMKPVSSRLLLILATPSAMRFPSDGCSKRSGGHLTRS